MFASIKLPLIILLVSISPASVIAGNNSGSAFSTWPDTGQTKCYNDTIEIPCPAEGDPFYGQDAQYAGPNRSYTVLGGGKVVQDNVTGLVWEMKGKMDGFQDYSNPNDADNTYTWCDTNPETNGGNVGTCGNHDTQDFIEQLNSSSYGGYSDWRLPTIKELATLADLGRKYPAIDPVFTATTQTDYYWSSTTFSNLNGKSWLVYFGVGNVLNGHKLNDHYARAVRGGNVPSKDRFIDNGDGTVTDSVTCLQWQKMPMDTNSDGAPDRLTWKQSLWAAENLTLAGKSDWRLPNIYEQLSLVDFSRYSPALDSALAATMQPLYSSYYWSSTTSTFYTTSSLYSDSAWLLFFHDGTASPSGEYLHNKIISYYGWAVRGRQCEELIAQARPKQAISDSVTGTGRKAVVLTHGWNSNVNAWAVGMANKICIDLGGTLTGEGEYHGYTSNITHYCSSLDWDVFVYDWKPDSATLVPWSAWANATEHGINLGKEIAKKKYIHVHFLAHSAGSMLIDSAKNYLQTIPDVPFIHLTFFDAYDPFAQIKDGVQLSAYGAGAGWVDNYVDKRTLDTLFANIMDGTKLLMPSAYNVDVTKWDIRQEPLPPAAALFRHEWPYIFYEQSTFLPMIYDLGYQLSLENGKNFPNSSRLTNSVCTLPKQSVGITPLMCESIQQVPPMEEKVEKIYTVGDQKAVILQLANSITGVISFFKDPISGLFKYWILQTGSPVWSKMTLNIKEPVNSLSFDYEFLSKPEAEGYVTIFVDNNIVGHIDQRNVNSSGVHSSDRMYVGALAPGVHTVAIRIDPYSTVHSSVRLTNLKLAQIEFEKGEEFPWEMFMPAIKGKHMR